VGAGNWEHHRVALALAANDGARFAAPAGEIAGAGPLFVDVRLAIDVDGDRQWLGGQVALGDAAPAAPTTVSLNVGGNLSVSGAGDVRVGAPPIDAFPAIPTRANLDLRPIRAPQPNDAPAADRLTTVLWQDPESGKVHELDFRSKSRLVFGRNRPAKDPDVDGMMRVLPVESGRDDQANRAMSGQHFAVTLRDGRLWLVDLSQNGTLLDGRRVTARQPIALAHGQRISPLSDASLTHLLSYRVSLATDGDRISTAELVSSRR
jgi:hypothetical protein